jgi:hypothetical protein
LKPLWLLETGTFLNVDLSRFYPAICFPLSVSEPIRLTQTESQRADDGLIPSRRPGLAVVSDSYLHEVKTGHSEFRFSCVQQPLVRRPRRPSRAARVAGRRGGWRVARARVNHRSDRGPAVSSLESHGIKPGAAAGDRFGPCISTCTETTSVYSDHYATAAY